jgi:hypothetical protein
VNPPIDRARDTLLLRVRSAASGLTGLGRKGFRTALAALAAAWMLPAPVWAQTRTGGRTHVGGQLVDAPEINPKLLIGMLVLLVGGVLVLTARKRRRVKVS